MTRTARRRRVSRVELRDSKIQKAVKTGCPTLTGGAKVGKEKMVACGARLARTLAQQEMLTEDRIGMWNTLAVATRMFTQVAVAADSRKNNT